MDPKASVTNVIWAIAGAVAFGERADIAEYIRALYGWIRAGGFRPSSTVYAQTIDDAIETYGLDGDQARVLRRRARRAIPAYLLED